MVIRKGQSSTRSCFPWCHKRHSQRVGRSGKHLNTPCTREAWRMSHAGNLFFREQKLYISPKLCIIVIVFIENLLKMYFKLLYLPNQYAIVS